MPELSIQQEFLRALESGTLVQIRALVAAGANVNRPVNGPDGETPLIRAIATAKPDVVQALIDAGADVNLAEKGPRSWTPLMHAHDKPEITLLLLAAGADVNARTPSRVIVSSDGGRTTRCGGETALHLAAAANNSQVVQLLIAGGAEVEAKSANGLGPLDFAIAQGRPTEAAGALVEAGAELTPQRLQAMHAAAHAVDSDLLRFPWAAETAPNLEKGPATLMPSNQERPTLKTTAMAEGPLGGFKCPKCQSLIYSHKSRMCGNCGAALPAETLLTDERIEELQQQRQWARDLADAFGSKTGSVNSASRSKGSSEEIRNAGNLSPDELLRLNSCAEEFRQRDRPDFILYLLAYGLMLGTIVLLSSTVGRIPAKAWLPITGFFALLAYAAWQRCSPICPRCKQNIRICAASHCHVCGTILRGGRCERCGVDNSWSGFLFPSRNLGKFRWIRFCSGCGVLLGSQVRRWGAGGGL